MGECMNATLRLFYFRLQLQLNKQFIFMMVKLNVRKSIAASIHISLWRFIKSFQSTSTESSALLSTWRNPLSWCWYANTYFRSIYIWICFEYFIDCLKFPPFAISKPYSSKLSYELIIECLIYWMKIGLRRSFSAYG